MRPLIRQGDLLFVPIETTPQGKIRQGEKIILRGEATGHAHRIDDACDGEIYFDQEGLPCGVRAGAGTKVVHDEHAPTLLTGNYKIVIQHEYDPDEANRQRRVAD